MSALFLRSPTGRLSLGSPDATHYFITTVKCCHRHHGNPTTAQPLRKPAQHILLVDRMIYILYIYMTSNVLPTCSCLSNLLRVAGGGRAWTKIYCSTCVPMDGPQQDATTPRLSLTHNTHTNAAKLPNSLGHSSCCRSSLTETTSPWWGLRLNKLKEDNSIFANNHEKHTHTQA